MHRHFSRKLGKEIATIHPGEYYASGEDIIIATVLGSCVAVALYDKTLAVGGLNHFMLPDSLTSDNILASDSARYGVHAMELLINSLMKQGARRNRLGAKVFGGGSVLGNFSEFARRIPESNVKLAFEVLSTERIPVDRQDVGGTIVRKVLFFPATARVLLKRIEGRFENRVEAEEEAYLRRLHGDMKKSGEITLF